MSDLALPPTRAARQDRLARTLGLLRDHALRLIAGAFALATLGDMLARQVRSASIPISSFEQHHWRQAFTFSIAFNFAHTSPNVFLPRMFSIVNGSNVVGMEAPVYPLLCAPLLRLTNDSVLPCRLLSCASLVVLVVALACVMLRDRPWAIIGLSIAAGLSPMAWVEFRQVQPEALMAALATCAACALFCYARTERTTHLATGVALATLAVLTKPSALATLPALWLFAVLGRQGRASAGRLLRVTLVFLPVLAAWAAWDQWSTHLLVHYARGFETISIQRDPGQMLAMLGTAAHARQLLLHVVPSYACGWWLFPTCLVGVVDALGSPERRSTGIAWVAWTLCVGIELLCFGDRLHTNAYYAVTLLPPILVFAAQGLATVGEALESGLRTPVRRLAIVVGPATMLGGWWLARSAAATGRIAAADAAFRSPGVWTDDLGLGLLVLALLAGCVAMASAGARRMPPAASAIALVTIGLCGGTAREGARQLLAHVAAEPRRGEVVARLEALRAVVDRYSSRTDTVVVVDCDIECLYRVRRNGLHAKLGELDEAALGRWAGQGARLLVHFKKAPLPEAARKLPVLGNGDSWSVSCLPGQSCPERVR